MSFLEKVKNSYTRKPNAINFMLMDGVINRSEHTLLDFILMFSFSKKHRTSITQLSKMTTMDRENVSSCLKSLVEKKIIGIQKIDKYIIVHLNITVEVNCTIKIEDRNDAIREEEELINSEEIDQDFDLPENPQVKPDYLPENPQVTCRKTGTIERRYKNKIENKDISRNLTVVSPEKPVTPQKIVKEAFIDEYQRRYKIRPSVDNARSNTIFKKLVDEVGGEDAIGLCHAYLQNNDQYFIKNRHPLNLLISSIDKIRVDSLHGRVTSVDQRDLDLDEHNQRIMEKVLRKRGQL